MKFEEVEIIDKGSYRLVKINCPHWGSQKYIKNSTEYKTELSSNYLRQLARYKKAKWMVNEMYRVTDESLPVKIMLDLLNRSEGIPDGNILDFGCGTCGASISLAKNNTNCIIYGVDTDLNKIELSNILLKEKHLDRRIKPIYLKDTSKLPFQSEYFDLIVVPAVIEHIHPIERPQIFNEMNRVLNRGGRLEIQGTPNRLYPFDFHTSNLFLVPYMPDKIAHWYIRNFSKKIKNQTVSWDELLDRGVRGSTYFAIKKYFPNMELVNTDDYMRIFKSEFLPEKFLKRCFGLPYYIIYMTICRWFKLPLSAFLKDLQFVLRKKLV